MVSKWVITPIASNTPAPVIVPARREAVVCIAWQIHLPGDSLVKSREKHVGSCYPIGERLGARDDGYFPIFLLNLGAISNPLESSKSRRVAWDGEGGECFSWRLSLEILLSSEVWKDFCDGSPFFSREN